MLKEIMAALKTLNSLFLNLQVDGSDRYVYEYVYNLFVLVVQLKPKTILDLGTGGKAIATMAMLTGLIYNGLGGHVTAVELKDYPADRVKLFHEQIEKMGAAEMVKFVTCDDLNFEITENVDMIFLDTSHTYEHTLAELNKFSQWTRLIVLHDTRVDSDVPQAVQKAIDVFLKDHSEWRNFEVGATPYGLGILYKEVKS